MNKFNMFITAVCVLPSFYFQILDLTIEWFWFFILIYFEWRDTENQQ